MYEGSIKLCCNCQAMHQSCSREASTVAGETEKLSDLGVTLITVTSGGDTFETGRVTGALVQDPELT